MDRDFRAITLDAMHHLALLFGENRKEQSAENCEEEGRDYQGDFHFHGTVILSPELSLGWGGMDIASM